MPNICLFTRHYLTYPVIKLKISRNFHNYKVEGVDDLQGWIDLSTPLIDLIVQWLGVYICTFEGCHLCHRPLQHLGICICMCFQIYIYMYVDTFGGGLGGLPGLIFCDLQGFC